MRPRWSARCVVMGNLERSDWSPRGWGRTACIVTADDGTYGVGFTIHHGPVTSIINDHLGPTLVGQNCMATERLWDVMQRSTAQYGTAGIASYAISAVDNALWDLKGKILGRPVYELLGGPQKDRIFCYASATDVGYGLENSIEWFLELGFRAVKVFLQYGPDDGLDGLRKNEDIVARAREQIGGEVELMVDAWTSPDAEYAIRLAGMLEPYRIKWLEDYLRPEDLGQLLQSAATTARGDSGDRRALVQHLPVRPRCGQRARGHRAARRAVGRRHIGQRADRPSR